MRVLRLTGLLAVCCVAVSVWAEGFLGQLSPEQKQRLGLDQLTPAQRAELDAAIESYRRTGEVAAARMAAEAAVAEYRKQEEPGVISRALEVFKRNAEDRPAAEAERVTAVLQGKFTGWSGNTLFRLDNGQVWRQASTDNYYSKAREGVPVVLYKSASGYWRLRVLDDEGAWVTVRRVQ